jgi:hypothetical protein
MPTINMTNPTKTEIEKTSVYILSDHRTLMDELKMELRKQGVKTNMSQLARVAIDLLAEQELEMLIRRLTT